MSTLIVVYTSQGRIHRCDANCYNATDPHCECVCGGANHGKGYAIAREQTDQNAQLFVDAFRAKHPHLTFRAYRTNGALIEIRQRLLF